jgi:glucose/mannose-6-phosphate isomerase
MEMKELVKNFPKQLKEAVEIASNAQLGKVNSEVRNVVIAGLGGSGIGGSIAAELAFPVCAVPVNVVKGYFIPHYVNEYSLVIVSSYSGNTEETIACMKQAIDRGAVVSCITSGGAVADFARQHKLPLILIPGGMPPRACVGYSLTQLIRIFTHFNLLPVNQIEVIGKAADLLIAEQKDIVEQTSLLAKQILGKTPVIYCTTPYEGVAVRLRQQLNENSKILCWHHVIPEMNHNELVGWAGGNEETAVIFLNDKEDYERNLYRMELNRQIISKYTPHIFDINAKGNDLLTKYIYFIHFGDWLSVELAALRGVDAVEVNVINFLKGELNKR